MQVARLISKFRPTRPVVAVTSHAHIARRMALLSGVVPIVLPEFSGAGRTPVPTFCILSPTTWPSTPEDVEAILQDTMRAGKHLGLCASGDQVVALHDENVADDEESASVMRILVVP